MPNEKRKGVANEVPVQSTSIILGSDHDHPVRRFSLFPPYQQIGRGQYHQDHRGPETETTTIPPSKIAPRFLRMAQQESSRGKDGLDLRRYHIAPILQPDGARQPRLEMMIATHVGGIFRPAPTNVVGGTTPGLHIIIDARGAGVWIAAG